MKITYIKLKNVAGLSVGLGTDELEIDFAKSSNKILAIRGRNGSGKSVLISSLSPFAYVTSLDDRSNIPYINLHKDGYKEIHYIDGNDEYIIKHYFKATKDTHSVKSYFTKNGEELNENGNVSSFNQLVEIHMGLTQEMMRLIRIGTNVNSFITLTPAKRKEYIGRLIEEIDMYLKIYKKINDDLRVVKVMIQTNDNNLYNCHIDDPIIENDNLSKMTKEIHKYEKERDELIAKISKLNALMKENDIDELRRQQQTAENAIKDFQTVEQKVQSLGLTNTSLNELIKSHSVLTSKKVDTQSEINSYRISIDNIHHSIDRLEVVIKRITSNNDIQSLLLAIDDMKRNLSSTSDLIRSFVYLGSPSDDVHLLVSKLQSFNQISQMIYTLGSKSIEVYIRLKTQKISIDKWLKEQSQKMLSHIKRTDIEILLKQIFADDMLIMPNCDTEFTNCPYYRIYDTISMMKDKIEEDSYDEEILRSVQVISHNIDNILNELDGLRYIKIPDSLSDGFREERILERLSKKLPFFDVSSIQEYLSILRDYEIFIQNSEKLKSYEYQLSIYQKSGIDSHMQEIEHFKSEIEKYKSQISHLELELSSITNEISITEEKISLVTKYNDSKKYQSTYEGILKNTKKILEPLESASSEKMELDFQLRQLLNAINSLRERHKIMENKLNEYNRLLEGGKVLSKKYRELSIILESVSTKKGIPVFYMKRYLTKIQKLSNDLLSLIYDEEFALSAFNVTPETFEVPYIKNGRKIPDIKYASQSEIALSTMALSFALASNASGKYNILLLDEIDAGLDDANRSAFLKMLYMQMELLQAEQVFIISHNLSQMVNVPMDCIDLSDVSMKSKLQNVIYSQE